MTTITNIDSGTKVPDWLDLDAIVPPELRERMAALTEEFRAIEPTVRDLCIRAWAVDVEYHESVRHAQDETGTRVELGDLLGVLTGMEDFFLAVVALKYHLFGVVEDFDGEPDWLKPERARWAEEHGGKVPYFWPEARAEQGEQPS